MGLMTVLHEGQRMAIKAPGPGILDFAVQAFACRRGMRNERIRGLGRTISFGTEYRTAGNHGLMMACVIHLDELRIKYKGSSFFFVGTMADTSNFTLPEGARPTHNVHGEWSFRTQSGWIGYAPKRIDVDSVQERFLLEMIEERLGDTSLTLLEAIALDDIYGHLAGEGCAVAAQNDHLYRR